MRILCVAAYRSNHADRHLQLLGRAGFDVHLAEVNPPVDTVPPIAGVTHHKPTEEHYARPREERPLEPPPRLRDRLFRRAPRRLPPDREAHLLRLGDPAAFRFHQSRADGAAHWVAGLLDMLRPDVLHSFALHQASFMTMVARDRSAVSPVWIVSNWGCDIHHFGQHPRLRDDYGPAIRWTLAEADGYFAETRRDDALARRFGFTGKTLAIAPIGGGFDIDRYASLRSGEPPSRRRLIMLKGYQGQDSGLMVGRALTAIEALAKAAPALGGYELNLYAAPEQRVQDAALALQAEHGIPLRIHPHLPYDDLMRLHGQARFSIGNSETDGIATSAIEAMLMGSVPVQSDTSALPEWIEADGALMVRHDDAESIAEAIRRAATDDAFVDRAARSNDVSLRQRFSSEAVDHRIVEMYRKAATLRRRR